MQGKIHSIETFGTVDGPGVRYVIFVQGCPLRCLYCHNPDTWDIMGGTTQTVEELVQDIAKYSRYIKGVTVSGGEPLLQLDFLIELFSKVKSMGLNTCVDTSGAVFNKNNQALLTKLDKFCNVCDLVLLDIKHINPIMHKKLTGQTNEHILDFAKYLDKKGVSMWLRYVLVPTINSDKKSLMEWKIFADGLKNVTKIEILPYHTLAKDKYRKLGVDYPLEGICEPTNDELELAKTILIKKEKG